MLIRFFLALLIAFPASAQVFNPPDLTPYVAKTDNVVLPGTFTVATLPTCGASMQGRYAYVTDLGGGPDMVICASSFWKHIRLGSPATIATTSNFTITPLSSPPIMLLTGSFTLGSTTTMTIATSGLYPGYMLYLRKPGALGTAVLGITVAGSGSTLPIVGNQTYLFVYDGTALQQIQ